MLEPSWRWRFQSPGDRRRRRARFRPSERGSEAADDDGNNVPAIDLSRHSSIGVTAARFLLGPRPSSLRGPNTAASMSPLPRRHQHHHSPEEQKSTNTTPFLTMALLRLEQIFPQFCLPLAQASHENISRACAVLDSSLTPPTNNHPVGHASPSNSSSASGSPRSPRSPRSPTMGFLHWLPDPSPSKRASTRSLSPPTAASSAAAMALEGEWDSLLHGFLVLSTAEYLYQDLQQLKRGHSLRGLYEYVLLQLEQVHATLCEPFLSIPTDAAASRENKYIAAARSVAQTLQSLLTLCQVRVQLIDLQSNLFTVGNLEEVKDSFCTLLAVTIASTQSATSTNDDPASELPSPMAADPVKGSLIQELKIWRYLLEACVGLERCE